MENALTQALANAASNMPKGEELHTENLDSIADPSIDALQSIANHTLLAADEIATGWNELHSAKRRMQEQPHLIAYNDPQQDGLLLVNIKTVAAKIDLTNSRLDALADMITEVSTTISKAAQTMPSTSDLSHRSLDEWPDSKLINELIERENDLMPFYFELLKRIGSPELHNLVMSSMQGKNASMITLAQLCAAMGTMTSQPQPITEIQRLEQMDEVARNKFAQRMNQMNPTTIPTPTTPYTPYQSAPTPQYFGQATEEYVRQTNRSAT